MKERQSIAILGSTGHVGRVLTAGLAGHYPLALYARRPDVARDFVSRNVPQAAVEVADLADLCDGSHSVLINCIGIGNPADVAANPSRVYEVTEFADELSLAHLARCTGTRLISISSGAAYCSDFQEPADDSTTVELAPNGIRPDQHYGVAKLASEARHRAMVDLPIIDLRLFGLFSRFADLDAAYLMTDVARALRAAAELVTGPVDVTRDYVSPADLCALVAACIEASPRNDVFDVCSAGPVRKFEMLDALVSDFGLSYRIDGPDDSATGAKPAYYSRSRRAAAVGYQPSADSLQTVQQELRALVGTFA